MRAVLFLFKLIEGSLSVACMVVHIIGFLDRNEPLPHEMLFCGTFFAFMLISFAGCLGICLRTAVPLLVDVIIAFLASIFFIVASIVAMTYVENDEHLMFLTDKEEASHNFFVISRHQSLLSLAAGLFFLMHTILVSDVLIIHKPHLTEDDGAYNPIQLNNFFEPLLNMIGKALQRYKIVKNIEWYNNCMYSIEISTERNIDRVI